MVDFRKAFLLLAVLVTLIGVVSAQPSQCVANSGITPPVRAEGVAEEVGQVIITCTGGTSTIAGDPIPTVNIQIYLNTNVTSRLVSGGSEAMLLIDEPLPAAQVRCVPVSPATTCPVTAAGGGVYTGPNVWQAQQSGANSLTWFGVPFDPPGTTPRRTIRLVNVRANASAIGIGSLIPLPIQMFISISGTGSLALSNNQLTVGSVQAGLKFTASTLATYNQCEPGPYTFTITFAENFGTAFRQKDTPSANQDIPGAIYNTESMFYGPALPTGAGVATQGTRLIARFSNVPANVTLTVPIANQTSVNGDIAVLQAAGTDGSTTSNTDGKVALTGGAGAAVWEVTTSNATAASAIPIIVTMNYSTPLPGLGTATVSGNYAPTTTVFTASSSAPVPRFVDNPQSATTFAITSCKTNLLFPFVANAGGFDTGIVISNTSQDPFGTATQTGPCVLNYYGTTGGTGAAPGAQTSGTVAPGAQLVATLSGGGNLGITATPGFQGYIIAQCSFQYAHGFAFISDLGASRVAEGYLALVMDKQKSAFPRTGTSSEVLGF